MVRSRLWYALFPLDAYALSFRFEAPLSRRQAIARIREWEGVARLPRNVQVWPSDEKADRS